MRAVLVFCEGHHDVAFALRSLGAHGGCEWVDKPVGELPSPFGRVRPAGKGLIATRYERQALEELTVQAAAHPPLPCFESVVENTATNTLFVLVRTHGQDQVDPVLDLLQALNDSITEEHAGTFDVSQYAAAFLFDANGEGVASTLAAFRDRYGTHFGDLSNIEHGKWVATNTVPVGCFVFHRSARDQTGTLEDHLAPMAESAWPERYAAARRFIDDNREDADEVSSSDAAQLKAIVTATGQFGLPGAPMTVIVGNQKKGLPRAQFDESRLSAELASFLAGAPWNDAREQRRQGARGGQAPVRRRPPWNDA